MAVKQVSIFVENKEGRIKKAIDTLAKQNINIRALSIADTTKYGILRLIVSDNEKAIEFCKVNNLIGVCGTDFHNPDQPILTAMYIPDDVNDEKAFVKCLFDRQFQLSCDEKTYKIEF